MRRETKTPLVDDCWWLVAWWKDVEADGEAGSVADGAGLVVEDGKSHGSLGVTALKLR